MQVNRERQTFRGELRCHDVLFSCEGTAEEVVIQRLVEGHRLIVADNNIVRDINNHPYTGYRKARDIENHFLGLNYPLGLMIVRIVDVHPGAFKLKTIYREHIIVRDVITRTEIEALILVREGAYQDWYQHGKSNGVLPHQWCIQHLNMRNVKNRGFLEQYWIDSEMVVNAIENYMQCLGRHKDDQLNLADMLID